MYWHRILVEFLFRGLLLDESRALQFDLKVVEYRGNTTYQTRESRTRLIERLMIFTLLTLIHSRNSFKQDVCVIATALPVVCLSLSPTISTVPQKFAPQHITTLTEHLPEFHPTTPTITPPPNSRIFLATICCRGRLLRGRDNQWEEQFKGTMGIIGRLVGMFSSSVAPEDAEVGSSARERENGEDEGREGTDLGRVEEEGMFYSFIAICNK